MFSKVPLRVRIVSLQIANGILEARFADAAKRHWRFDRWINDEDAITRIQEGCEYEMGFTSKGEYPSDNPRMAGANELSFTHSTPMAEIMVDGKKEYWILESGDHPV